MKIVRVNDKNLDIIVESEEYIDIYSCHDYTEEGKNKNLDLDVVKWKINGLERFDKATENKFYIHAEPRLNNFVGYYDYHIIHNYSFKDIYVNAIRTIDINYKGRADFIGYATNDYCRFDTNIPDLWVANYSEIRNSLSSDITANKLDTYLSNKKLDFMDTNKTLKAFYDFTDKYAIYELNGIPNLYERHSERTAQITKINWLDKEKGIADLGDNLISGGNVKKLDIDRWNI